MNEIAALSPRILRPSDADPNWQWDRRIPALGHTSVDFERRVDHDRLRRYRLSRAKQALDASKCGALLLFDVNNIRYVTGTKIGEWERDKMCRFALLARDAEPFVWDFGSAAVHHRLYCDWLDPSHCRAGVVGMRGTIPPSFGLMKRYAEEIAGLLREAGVADMPVGVDYAETAMFFALQEAGLKIVDGQQIMLDAREIKNIDEIQLLNQAAAMVDGVYHTIWEELKPGVRENDIVGLGEQDALRDGIGRRRGDQRDLRRALQPASAQFHRPHLPAGRSGVLRHPAKLSGLPHLLLPHLQSRPRHASPA